MIASKQAFCLCTGDLTSSQSSELFLPHPTQSSLSRGSLPSPYFFFFPRENTPVPCSRHQALITRLYRFRLFKIVQIISLVINEKKRIIQLHKISRIHLMPLGIYRKLCDETLWKRWYISQNVVLIYPLGTGVRNFVTSHPNTVSNSCMGQRVGGGGGNRSKERGE